MKSMKSKMRPAVMLDTMAAEPMEPEYPYGLRICLEKEQIMMLGLHDAAIDDEFLITAKAKVCGVHKSENQSPGNDSYQHSVDLQITHMECEKKK